MFIPDKRFASAGYVLSTRAVLRTDLSMSRQDTMNAVARMSDFDIDEDDDVAIAQDVVRSFGVVRKDPAAHRRSVRFLHACLNRYLWTWESLGCVPPGPRPASVAVANWLATGTFVTGFAELCLPVTPIRQGAPVEDCDEPALSDLSAASSRLAYYCKTRSCIDAALVLVSLFWADAEGLQPDDETEFADWLSTVGIGVAWPEESGG
jgi:hypothetical protein